MKNIFTSIVLGAIALTQSVSADMLNDIMCGTFGIWGQATYLKPTQDGPSYATQTTGPLGPLPPPGGPVKSRSVCPRYEWGFEVGGLYLTRCNDYYAKIYGGWTEFTDTSRIQGFVSPNLPIFDASGGIFADILGQGFGSLKTEYWYIDNRAGRFLRRGCGSDLHAFLGARYVNLCERLIAALSGIDAQTSLAGDIRQRQRSEFSGAGPEIGFGGQFCVWGDFGISGEFGIMGLIGSRKNRVTSVQIVQNSAANGNQFQYDNCVGVIPAIDMKAGANWSMEYCKFKGGVEVGYKLTHYFNAFRSAITQGNTTVFRDVGFAGPYISIGLTY